MGLDGFSFMRDGWSPRGNRFVWDTIAIWDTFSLNITKMQANDSGE